MGDRCPTDVKYEFHGMDMDIYKDFSPSEGNKMLNVENEEVEAYTKLSGNDGANTPIGIIGAYLDGYDKGIQNGIIIGRRSVDPKRGKWIKDAENFGKYYCSECGFTHIPIGVPKYNFCPDCGSDNRYDKIHYIKEHQTKE